MPLESVAVIVVCHVPAFVYTPFAKPPAASVTHSIPSLLQSAVFSVNSAALNVLTVTPNVSVNEEPSNTSLIVKETSPEVAALTVKDKSLLVPAISVNVEVSKLNASSIAETTKVAVTPVFVIVAVPEALAPALWL